MKEGHIQLQDIRVMKGSEQIKQLEMESAGNMYLLKINERSFQTRKKVQFIAYKSIDQKNTKKVRMIE